MTLEEQADAAAHILAGEKQCSFCLDWTLERMARIVKSPGGYKGLTMCQPCMECVIDCNVYAGHVGGLREWGWDPMVMEGTYLSWDDWDDKTDPF